MDRQLRPVAAAAAGLLMLSLAGCTSTPPAASGATGSAASTGSAGTAGSAAPTGSAGTAGSTAPTGSAGTAGSAAPTGSAATAAWTAGFCGHVQEALRTTAALTADIPPTPPLRAATLADWQQRLQANRRAADTAVAAVSADLASAPPELAAASEPVAALTRGLIAANAGTGAWVTPLVAAADLGAVERRLAASGAVAAELHSGAVQLAEAAQRGLSCR